MQLCLGCNTELDLTYKFCYECGKPVQEMVSSVFRKQGKDTLNVFNSKI